MGTGTKIGLLLCLFLVVITIVNVLDRDIQGPPEDGRSTETSRASSGDWSSEGAGDAPGALPGDGEREGVMHSPVSPTSTARGDQLRPVSSGDVGSGVGTPPGRELSGLPGGVGEGGAGGDLERTLDGWGLHDPLAGFGPEAGTAVTPGSASPEVDRGTPTAEGQPALPSPRSTGPDGITGDGRGAEESGRMGNPVAARSVEGAAHLSGGVPAEGGASKDAKSRFPLQHEIVEGDTLWDLAVRYYGKGTLHAHIAAANSALSSGDEILPGTRITIPAPPAAPVAGAPKPRAGGKARPAEGGRTYRMKKGDSLYDIARRLLGKGTRWPEIVAANPGLGDPEQLPEGTVLEIPAK